MTAMWWHYTCLHGYKAIGEAGTLHPMRDVAPPGALDRLPWSVRPLTNIVWLTDLDVPNRHALGLTMSTLGCDRTRYRYRITADDDVEMVRYVDMRRTLPKWTREQIEAAPGALPIHWWIAYQAVPATFDPIGGPDA